jgi:hypothetical protein
LKPSPKKERESPYRAPAPYKPTFVPKTRRSLPWIVWIPILAGAGFIMALLIILLIEGMR